MKRLFPRLQPVDRDPSHSHRRSNRRGRRLGRIHWLAAERLEERALLAIVSHWTADNTAADSVGTNHGTLQSGTAYATGQIGQAFSFDGVNDRVGIADSESLKLTASLSIEGWVRAESLPSQQGEILFRGDDRGGLDPYSLSVQANGQLKFEVSSLVGAMSVSTTMPLSQIVHVAGTLDDATGAMRLYLNGVLMSQATTSVRPFGDLDPGSNPGIGIGNHGGAPNTPHNFPFHGLIDDLKVYDHALTAAEVEANYRAVLPTTVSIANVSRLEGHSGTQVFTFEVSRTGDTSGITTMDWQSANGTATVADGDYLSGSGQVIFNANETIATVQVTVNGDSAVEQNETFSVILSNAQGGAITDGTGLGTILNDETTFSISDAIASEGRTSGRFIDRFVAQGLSPLVQPRGLSFGPDGNLYVASLYTDEVLRYDGVTGTFIDAFVGSQEGGLDNPYAVVFGPDSNLYVSGARNGQVLRYDGISGGFLGVFTSGMALTLPRPIAFGPDGHLYVTSETGATSSQVVRFNGTSGAFMDVFVASGAGGLDDPRGLAFGPDGNLYVSEPATNSVLRFSGTTGAFLGDFVPLGSGGIDDPREIAFGPDGLLYVAENSKSNVLRYNGTTGAFVDEYFNSGSGGLNVPQGLTFDGDGNLYVTSALGGEVLRYGPESQAVITISLAAPSGLPVSVDFATTNGTAAAGGDYEPRAGTLTFAPGQTSLSVLVPTFNDAVGEVRETFSVNLSNAVGASIVDGTATGSIKDDDATKFYIVNDAGGSDSNNEYADATNRIENYVLASGNTAPRGVASNAAGDRIWVVDANNRVYVYNTSGGLLGSWIAKGLGSNPTIEGITTNGTDIWIVNTKTDRVYKFTGAASRLSGNQSAASSFSLSSGNTAPKDLVTEGTHFWVVNDGSAADQVFKYTLAGSLVASWTIDPINSSPTGITLDPTNPAHLWIVDNGSDDAVYEYLNSITVPNGGSRLADSRFLLASAGIYNPQGIADPPPGAAGAPMSPPAPTPPAPSTSPVVTVGLGQRLPAARPVEADLIVAAASSLRSEPIFVNPVRNGADVRPAQAATHWTLRANPLVAVEEGYWSTTCQDSDEDDARFEVMPAGAGGLRAADAADLLAEVAN